MKAHFYKYQALGNDMLVIDPAHFDQQLTPGLVRRLCDRHWGPGADGLCYGPLLPAQRPRAMRFFNPDGSPAEKSGNGLRIFARYLWDQGYESDRTFTVAIGPETIPVEIKDKAAQTIALGLGRLSFFSPDIPVSGPAREVVTEGLTIDGERYRITAVSIGNPHCVVFRERISAATVRWLGPRLETAPLFPQRINVQLVRVVDRHTLELEIWERGAGYTLASGTSASAAAGAAIKTGRCDSPITVRMAGGPAQVVVDAQWQVTQSGPVAAVYEGRLLADIL